MVQETRRIEVSNRTSSGSDSYPIVIDVTPETDDENLREIGAIGSLLIEIIQEVCDISGCITVEEITNGVRIVIKPALKTQQKHKSNPIFNV